MPPTGVLVSFIYPKQAKTSTKTQSAQYPVSIIVEKNTINVDFFFFKITLCPLKSNVIAVGGADLTKSKIYQFLIYLLLDPDVKF